MRVSRVSVAPSKYGVKSFSAQKFANTQKRGLVQTKTSSTSVRRTQERTRNVVTKSKQQTSLVKTPARSFYTTKLKLADYDPISYTKIPAGEPLEMPTEYWKKYRVDQTPEERKGAYYLTMGAFLTGATVATKNIVYDALESIGIAASVYAAANTEVDVSNIPEGTTSTALWRGKPMFVRHRTPEEIEIARNTPLSDLKDPQRDEDRTVRPEWLLVMAVCTHLGCVPISNAGDYNGWFCPCHGSHYDLSGRIRKGPAPLNLEVPPHYFLDDNHVFVGRDKPE